MPIETKRVEIRDQGTLVPAVAMLLVGGPEDRLLWRAGFGSMPLVLLVHLTGGKSAWDPHDWHDRTMQVSHRWLEENWAAHVDGAVVDVQYVLGETPAPKASECGQ